MPVILHAQSAPRVVMKKSLLPGVCCVLIVLKSAAAVKTPPLITVHPEKLYEYAAGETIILRCAASGNPQPTYTWTRNDADIFAVGPNGTISSRNHFIMNPSTGTLIINESRQFDQGYYKCKAMNELGTAVSDTAFVVRATLENFGKQGGGEVKAKLGEPLSLPCAPRLPTSYPAPVIYWSKRRESNGVFVPIDYSDRISQDLGGTLHFANVYNSSDAGRYRCNAHNTMLRRAAYSAETAVTIVADDVSSETTAPTLLYPSQSKTSLTVLQGKELRLKCIFGGNPTPKVKWLKTSGTSASSQSSFEHVGQELFIAASSVNDSGSYECRGQSEGLPDAIGIIEVTVNVPPRIISKPVPTVMGENETATFICDGSGVPKPTTTWYINGKPVTGRHRTTVIGSSLIIADLTLNDTAGIQCNVSHNETGWDAVSFYLLVRNEPPRITVPLPATMKLAEHRGASLQCAASGHPSPSIRWLKDGQEISNATLDLLNPKIEDSGVYTCAATNGVGRATYDVQLLVRRPTKIDVPPLDQTIAAGEETRLECEATTDEAEMQNLKVSWQKSRVAIDFENDEHRNKMKDGMSLVISRARVSDSGHYTCVAASDLDEAEATASLVVQGPPDPPLEVQIVVCGAKEAVLQWEQGSDNNAAIIDYQIEYRTQYDSQWFETASNGLSTEYSFEQLLPWANYTFRVRARNPRGFSEPSDLTPTSCVTPPDVPYKNPDGLKTVDEDSSKLVISWQAMKAIDRHGPGFFYEVNYTRQDPVTKLFTCPLDSVCHQRYAEDSASSSSGPPSQTEHQYVVPNQPPYAAYNISIRAHNAQGPSSAAPVVIIGHSGEGIPEANVADFSLDPEKPLTARNASFKWTHVDPISPSIRGLFRGYKIRYWKASQDDEKRSILILLHGDAPSGSGPSYAGRRRRRGALKSSHVHDLTATATIDQLPPYTKLYFDIAVLNGRYTGKESTPIAFMTLPAEPGMVSGLVTKEVGPKHVVIEWSPPVEPNGEITGYNILYQAITSGEPQDALSTTVSPGVLVQLKGDARQARLGSLQSNQLYRFTVRALTAVGPGIEKFIEVSTRTPGRPDAPIVSVTTPSQCGGCINVSWVPAATGEAASSFYVEFRQEGQEWRETTLEDDNINWVLLTNLSRTVYEVRVVASNGQNFKTPSEVKKVPLNISPAAEVEEPRTVFASAWFIGVVCGVAALIILIIAAIFIYRQRQAGRYSIKEPHETEKLKPEDDDGCSARAYPANSRPPVQRSREAMDMDRGMLEASGRGDDERSEDDDEDPTNFDEDGSFINKYRNDDLDDNRELGASSSRLPTSASSTAVKDDRAHGGGASPSARSSPQLSTFRQPTAKNQQPATPRSDGGSAATTNSGSCNALQQASTTNNTT